MGRILTTTKASRRFGCVRPQSSFAALAAASYAAAGGVGAAQIGALGWLGLGVVAVGVSVLEKALEMCRGCAEIVPRLHEVVC